MGGHATITQPTPTTHPPTPQPDLLLAGDFASVVQFLHTIPRHRLPPSPPALVRRAMRIKVRRGARLNSPFHPLHRSLCACADIEPYPRRTRGRLQNRAGG